MDNDDHSGGDGAATVRASSPSGSRPGAGPLSQPHAEIDLFSDAAEMRRTIIETSPDFIMMLTPDCVIRYINRVLKELEGQVVIGTSILQYIPPRDQAHTRAVFTRVLTTGEKETYETIYESPERGRLTFECRIVPIYRNGVIVGMTINARDVTAQKNTEQALRDALQSHRALIENSPVGIFSVAANGAIISANPAFHRLLQHEISTLHGKHIFDLMHADDRTASLQRFSDLVEGVLDTCSAELRFERSDGEFVWTRLSASTIQDDDGKMIRLVCVVEDVTERRRAEHSQKLLMRELDHRVKNNLAAIVTLTKQSIASARSFDEFEMTFMGRVAAMARSHEALASSNWTDLDLMRALTATLAPNVQVSPPRITLGGPPVKLNSRIVMPLCLTAHELATNAMRHGALSGGEGHVSLTWTHEGDRLSLTWRETGGPPVAPPDQPGLGSQLIEGFVRFELRGTLDVRYDRAGLQCDITVPTNDEAVTS